MTENDPLPPSNDPVTPVTPPSATPFTPTPAGPSPVDALKAGWAATTPFDQKLLIGGVAAAVVLAFGTLLTWVHAFIISISGVNTGNGKFVLLLALASIVVTGAALIRKLPVPLTWLALAGTHLGIVVMLLILMFRMHRAFSGMDMPDNPIVSGMAESVGLGIGIYLCLLAALAGAAAYATVAAPSLAKFQVPAAPKPLAIALGIGAAAGLLIGLLG